MNKTIRLLISVLACAITLTAASLSPGRYIFQAANGDTWDAGWAVHGWENGTAIHLYSLNNGVDQQFNFLANGEIQAAGNTSLYLADRGGILVLVGQNPDHFTINSSGNGYTIQDTSSGGNYVGNNLCGTGTSCNIPFSTTSDVWFIQGGSSPPPPTTTTINDTDASIVYSVGSSTYTNWYYYQGGGEDYNQNEHSSNFERSGATFEGASATVTFLGTGISWIGKKGRNYGMAAYAVDGGPAQVFDGYNPTEIDQNANVTISGLPFAQHVLQISLLAKKNAAATNYYQTIDAFRINGSPLPHYAGTIAGYKSSQLVYTGSWVCGGNNPTDLSNGHCWANVANASISWSFTGSLVEIFGRPDLEDGLFQVYIDGNFITTIDGQFGNVDDDSLNSVMLFSHQVSSGRHTIKIVGTGKGDSHATNTFVQIDEFVSF